ncbi:MAG: hypothetical protein C4310_06785 [Chloroflexota bacterium]
MMWVRLVLAIHLAVLGVTRAVALRLAKRQAACPPAPPASSESLPKLSAYFEVLLTTLYAINPVSLPDALILVLPWADLWRALGAAVLLAGSALFLWAHRALGPFWMDGLEGRQGRRLVRTGPYAWVRHPMYVALLLCDIGALLVIQNAVLLVPLGLWLATPGRARREEARLVRLFGQEYEAYRQMTGMFAPRLLQNPHLAMVAQRKLVSFRLDRGTLEDDMATDQAVLNAVRDVNDLAVLQDNGVLNLAVLDQAVMVNGGKGANI